MSRIIQIQNDFTSGELDPKLRARTDISQYKSGLTTARNVSIQPQGGAKRRDGTKYVATLDSGAANAVRMVSFEFSISDSYMLVFTPGKMYVFKNDRRAGFRLRILRRKRNTQTTNLEGALLKKSPLTKTPKTDE